jgi:hypothetical protein
MKFFTASLTKALIFLTTDLQEHDPPVEAGDVALHLVQLLHQLSQPDVSSQQLGKHSTLPRRDRKPVKI